MKDCPICKKANPDSAEKCDCGYDFKKQGQMGAGILPKHPDPFFQVKLDTVRTINVAGAIITISGALIIVLSLESGSLDIFYGTSGIAGLFVGLCLVAATAKGWRI
jgi:hypothetical protein